MSKDPRQLGTPQAGSAEQQYCGPCKTRQPHVKHTSPGNTYPVSTCIVCHPEVLDAPDGFPFRFEAFDCWELRRLIRVRDRNLGAGLRVYLRAGAGRDFHSLVSLERED